MSVSDVGNYVGFYILKQNTLNKHLLDLSELSLQPLFIWFTSSPLCVNTRLPRVHLGLPTPLASQGHLNMDSGVRVQDAHSCMIALCRARKTGEKGYTWANTANADDLCTL